MPGEIETQLSIASPMEEAIEFLRRYVELDAIPSV